MRRTIMEFQSLLQQASAAQNSGHRTCALSDGSLILWQLEGKPADYQQPILAALSGLSGNGPGAAYPRGWLYQPTTQP